MFENCPLSTWFSWKHKHENALVLVSCLPIQISGGSGWYKNFLSLKYRGCNIHPELGKIFFKDGDRIEQLHCYRIDKPPNPENWTKLAKMPILNRINCEGRFSVKRIFRGFLFLGRRIFSRILLPDSLQKNPPGKSPSKSSKTYTTKIHDTCLQSGRAN